MNKPKLLTLIIAAVVVVGIIVGAKLGNKAVPTGVALAAEAQMEATKYDSAGVDLNSAFTLKTATPLNLTMVKEKLTVEPAVAFQVKETVRAEEFLITPKEQLEPQQIYKFSLGLEGTTPLKWAFQTKGVFKIVSTLPRDKGTGVPLNSGIEISFSHPNVENLNDYFSISPKVEGTFEQHKKTMVFVPKNLMPGTIYTVTVKKGLPLAGSVETLGEDYTWQFETQENPQEERQFHLSFFKDVQEFPTGEKPLFQLNYFRFDQGRFPDVKVTVYKYKGAHEYIKAMKQKDKIPSWAFFSRQKYREDLARLEQVAKYTLPLRGEEGLSYFELPEALPAGYYVGEAMVDNAKQQLWFQVTDLSAYAGVYHDQTVVWVNDLLKGNPAQGAKVQPAGGGQVAQTGQDGLATLPTSQDSSTGVYAIISQGNKEAVLAVPMGFYNKEWQDLRRFQDNYWKYLYVDRGIYKPDDTVHFWGLVKSREKGRPIEQVTIRLLQDGGWPDEQVILSQDVALDDSTFTASLELPNLTPGYYYLEVNLQGKKLIQRGLEVATYSKPAYQLEIEPNRKALFADETMNFGIKASFFEGTPAANIPINYSLDQQRGSVTTNAEGVAGFPFTPAYQPEQRWPVHYAYLYLSTNQPESGEITGEAQVAVLNNDIDIEATGKASAGTGRVEMTVNKLTTSKVNSGQADPWERDAYLAGRVTQHQVKAKVYQEVWEKKEVGEYYDFISKKKEKRYDYTYKKVFVSEGEVRSDNEGKATFTFSLEPDKSYLVELAAQDFRGKQCVREVFVYGPGFYREWDYQWYHLVGIKPTNKYKVGEQVQVVMKKNGVSLAERKDGFLFIESRQGVLQSKVQNQGLYSTEFAKSLVPNFYIQGVYFDGRYYYEAAEYLAGFDAQEKALKLKVKTDKAEYRPGDTVQVEIEAKDNKNRPVEAKVNLNLVDEALYALADQTVDMLGALYNDSYLSGLIGSKSTHQPPSDSLGGAEKGGEGGSERKDFKDAVFFKTIATNKQGTAKVTLQVPDNLTSWRLTYQAVTPGLEAASGTTNIKVKLPFFITMTVSDTYLTGDKPVIPLNAFGSKLGAGTQVEYTAKLSKGKTVSQISTTGTAHKMARLPLPVLEQGSYELSVTGKTKEGLSDTLTLSFQAADSTQTLRNTGFFLLDENTILSGGRDSLTTLTFTDYRRSQYLESLLRLNGLSGSRVEQKLAQLTSGILLKTYFPETDRVEEPEMFNLENYQTPEGGIALLPYGGPELELSAKIAALEQEGFDSFALARYFTAILADPKESRERSLIALCGLGSLGQPVLQEVQLLTQEKNLTIKERLYLILALSELGDEQKAALLLQELIKTHGEVIGSSLRIKTGADQDDILEPTALAAAAAAALNLEEKHQLQQYLLENETKDILTYLEQVLFLEKALPQAGKEGVSFTYTLEGGKQKITLQPGETYTLLLTPEKLAALKFANITGKVGVCASYNAPVKLQQESSLDGVKISRSYQVQGKSTTELGFNDLVKVTISYEFGSQAPDGEYQVNDYLPAGLRLVQKPYYRGLGDRNLGYPLEVNGQKAIFLVGKKNGSFHYYARVINAGNFKAEKTILQHLKSSKVYGFTPDYKVNIQ